MVFSHNIKKQLLKLLFFTLMNKFDEVGKFCTLSFSIHKSLNFKEAYCLLNRVLWRVYFAPYKSPPFANLPAPFDKIVHRFGVLVDTILCDLHP